MKKMLFTCFLLGAGVCQAQYAPQALVTGSTAISKTSSQFVAWASDCRVQRGLQQINDASFGYASVGDSSAAIGAPDGGIVSLGDNGVALLSFSRPVTDGPGPDFAVFENGFPNINDPEEAFLELAFVEVSSDGIHFTRFPATSLTQDTAQLSSIGTPSHINARQLNNLAGKYIGSWGTPFDLAELSGTAGLDIFAITHIRIIDVIGSIGSVGTVDGNGRRINDPFPTPFPGGGFDLDAVGILHALPTNVAVEGSFEGLTLYPNPAGDELMLTLPGHAGPATIVLHDVLGRILQQQTGVSGTVKLSMNDLAPGSYYLTIRTEKGAACIKAFLHR